MEKEDKIINEKDVIVDNSSAETAGNEPQGERPVNDSKTWFIRNYISILLLEFYS